MKTTMSNKIGYTVMIAMYVLLGALLSSVINALCGGETIWGDLFTDMARECDGYEFVLKAALTVVLVGMVLHLVWVGMGVRHSQKKEAREAARQKIEQTFADRKPTEIVASTRIVKEEPTICISWHAVDNTTGSTELTFETLRRHGGWSIGQPGHSDLGLNDAALATRQLLLYMENHDRLAIKHFPIGREGSVRVNGKPLEPGQSQDLDGKTHVAVGGSRISITVQ